MMHPILIGYTSLTVKEKGKNPKGNRVRVSADSHQSCFLYTLVLPLSMSTALTDTATQAAVVMSQEAAQPIGFDSPLPFPACSLLSQSLFARHLIFLFNNQP